MNKKTRFFLLASALTIAVGLGTGLLAYYGGLPTLASSGSAGPDELRYIPADAAVVAYANVREVMASEFRQNLKQILPHEDKQGQDEFLRETGIDVEQDIDNVTACVLSADGREPSGFVMMRGRFNAGELEARARQHKSDIVVETFQGARLLRLAHGHEGKSAVLAFVEPGLLMFGDEGGVKRALSKKAPSVTTNGELMGLIADAEGNANLWAVGRVEALTKNAKLPDQIASQLPSVTWFSASSRINGGLTGTLRAEARDDEAAKNLRDVVQGFVALAKLQAGNKPEVQSLVQSIQLSGSGKSVALSFQVPSDLINSVAAGKGKAILQ